MKMTRRIYEIGTERKCSGKPCGRRVWPRGVREHGTHHMEKMEQNENAPHGTTRRMKMVWIGRCAFGGVSSARYESLFLEARRRHSPPRAQKWLRSRRGSDKVTTSEQLCIRNVWASLLCLESRKCSECNAKIDPLVPAGSDSMCTGEFKIQNGFR